MTWLVALLIVGPAHAGFWRDLCEGWLVQDNPIEYETLFDDELVKQYRQEGGRAAWARTCSDTLRQLGREIRRRRTSAALSEALEDYQRFEARPPGWAHRREPECVGAHG